MGHWNIGLVLLQEAIKEMPVVHPVYSAWAEPSPSWLNTLDPGPATIDASTEASQSPCQVLLSIHEIPAGTLRPRHPSENETTFDGTRGSLPPPDGSGTSF